MALETVVFKQDPFDFSYKEMYNIWGLEEMKPKNIDPNGISDIAGNGSPEVTGAGDGREFLIPMTPNNVGVMRRKRRRPRSPKNMEEMENQRMTHIAVERNRRRQMNDYLSVLRSLMPPSYSQRGDQASIVGGAINFVKELEQLLQCLEANNKKSNNISNIRSKLFTNFFTFPQYSTSPINHFPCNFPVEPTQTLSKVGDIEVTMAESHCNIKILTQKRPKQILILVAGLHSFSLPILHLSTTTVDQLVLYSFIVKVNDESRLTSVNDIATAVHELVGMIQEEAS